MSPRTSSVEGLDNEVLIPSTSGHAALALAVPAPLADVADVPRSFLVTAFQSGSEVT